jgi:hypothetical protein
MPNSKISALTSATTPLAGTETLPIVQSSTTKQVSVANLTAGRAVTMLSNTMVSSSAVNDVDKTGGGSYGYRIKGNDQANVRFRFENTGGQIYELVGGNPGASNSGWAIFDATAGATRLYLDLSGNWTVNTGNVIQGTANKGFNFTANTPASGNTSQLLNDYQEGTWTPSFVNGTFGYSFQSGFYTKVGRLVTISGLIVWSSKSGAGDLSISIPFTVNSSNYYRGGISLGNCNGLILSAGYAIVGTLDQSATSIDFYFNVSAASAQRMTIANMNSSGAVQFTATYMV